MSPVTGTTLLDGLGDGTATLGAGVLVGSTDAALEAAGEGTT